MQLGVADSVDFVGQRADTDRLLGQSSIVLATPPAEPFGFSVVEAMAHGVPVVAAAGGAHVETMGDAGMLFPPGDAQAAADALVRLAADRDLRLQVGRRSPRPPTAAVLAQQHLDGLERLYLEVIEERNAADGRATERPGRRNGWQLTEQLGGRGPGGQRSVGVPFRLEVTDRYSAIWAAAMLFHE